MATMDRTVLFLNTSLQSIKCHTLEIHISNPCTHGPGGWPILAWVSYTVCRRKVLALGTLNAPVLMLLEYKAEQYELWTNP